jgi:hypothetical protein
MVVHDIESQVNSYVISAKDRLDISGCRPRISFTIVSFKIGKVSLDAICRAHRMSWSFSGNADVIFDLKMVRDAAVPIFAKHALSPLGPSESTLLWPYFFDTMNAY